MQFSLAALRVAGRVLVERDVVPETHVLIDERTALREAEVDAVVALLRRGDDAADAVRDLDATFVVRAVGYLVVSVASNASALVGGPPPDDEGTLLSIEAPRPGEERRRLLATVSAQLRPSSPWFQDSARAGIALGVAVLIVLLTSVETAFWVACRYPLGAPVQRVRHRRAHPRGRGQGIRDRVRGRGCGPRRGRHRPNRPLDHDDPRILLRGRLPQVLGFVAGQAAFTVLVVALFNIIVPDGWRTGLVRIRTS